jgi:hypothetical protein
MVVVPFCPLPACGKGVLIVAGLIGSFAWLFFCLFGCCFFCLNQDLPDFRIIRIGLVQDVLYPDGLRDGNEKTRTVEPQGAGSHRGLPLPDWGSMVRVRC